MDHRGNEIEAGFTDNSQIATPSGNPSSGFTRAYFKSDDNLYRKNSAGGEALIGGGASNYWTNIVSESGGSLANWTSYGGGTWSTDGVVISQTDTGAASRCLRYNTPFNSGNFIFQTDIKIVSSTTGVAGMVLNDNTTTISGFFTNDTNGNGSVTNAFRSGTANTSEGSATLTPSIPFGTWFTFRVVVTSLFTPLNTANAPNVDFYINGSYIGTLAHTTSSAFLGTYFALITNGSSAQFRNIKVWVPNYPS